MRRRLIAMGGLLAAAPMARAMGMGGGMMGGGGGGFGNGMGQQRGGWPWSVFCPDVDRGHGSQGRADQEHESSRDPYGNLDLSAAQRKRIEQIRDEMDREERRRIGSVLSPQQRAQLDRDRDRR